MLRERHRDRRQTDRDEETGRETEREDRHRENGSNFDLINILLFCT